MSLSKIWRNSWCKLQIFRPPNTIALLNNASFYKTKDVKKLLLDLFDTVAFIPPYTPQYAPIELYFNIIKMKIKRTIKNQTIKLKSLEGEKHIKELISQISQK